ncbi:MAG: hypothetical protein MJ085_03295 [Clostridia bacterium]|nr:hypothetical protein [Clostridia bacterium]
MAEKKKPFVAPTMKKIDLPPDPMQELVEVYLPKATGREENFVFVGLNGKGYQIKRGETVKVPRPVYDILAASERASEKQEAFLAAQRERAQSTAFRL